MAYNYNAYANYYHPSAGYTAAASPYTQNAFPAPTQQGIVVPTCSFLVFQASLIA